jgi:tRNA A-37 threonylcarbamoyl transferase component Bud32
MVDCPRVSSSRDGKESLMMTPERWHRISEILEQALELAPEKRPRFLDVACSSDPSLRSEVQSFLSAHETATPGFLDRPPVRSSLLMPGTKLGDYEIVSQLGEGGMGVVYKARDLRLERPVAIKVIREHVLSDGSRLRRFEQEAQAAAALNHPNILAVYQFGAYQGAPYLVSELLEGETLREELKRGPLSQTRTTELAEQIAEGLSAAHQRGVVHRDLKPENLFVSKEQRVKILDFGLAKLLEKGPEGPEAAAEFQTNPGMVAGTVGYASPEQLRGEKLDARTDVFSLGVVMYEMATGQRPFAAESSGATFEATLNRQPALPGSVNAAVSHEFERILLKALEKDREIRYQGAAEIRADLKRLKRNADSGRSGIHGSVTRGELEGRGKALRGWRLPGLIGLSLAVVVGAWRLYAPMSSLLTMHLSRPVSSLHAQIDAPPMNSFRMTGDTAGPPVISPNGAYVAFTASGKDGKFRLWVRALNSIEARALPETDGAYFPFWSADSNSLGFFADGKLKSVGLLIGSSVVVCEAADGRGGSWNAKGDIVFTPGPTAPLLRVKAIGGAPQPVTTLDKARHTTHRWPYFLPDQEHFLYFAANHEPSKSHDDMVYYASIDGGENRELFHADTDAVYADGYLLFAIGSSLMARRFDAKKGELLGEPILLAANAINDTLTWHTDVSASDAGTLIYGGAGSGSRQLVWLDRKTYAQTEIAVDGLAQLFLARLSPQGDRIALQKDHAGYDVSVYDLRDKMTLASFPKLYRDLWPTWSPDGKSIAYSSLREGQYHIYRVSADGVGKEAEMLRDDRRIVPFDWVGENLLFLRGGLGNEFECWDFSLKNRTKRKVLENVDACALSPDGKWVAFPARENLPGSNSPGPLKVYVTKLEGGQAYYQVSENSGVAAQWSQDGKEIYYLEQSTLTLVRVGVKVSDGVPHFKVLDKSSPNVLAELIYAVSPDKKRILIQRIPEPTVVVVTDFARELEKR